MADRCRPKGGYGPPQTTGVCATDRARARSDAGRQNRGRPDVIVKFTPHFDPASEINGPAKSTRRFGRLERGMAMMGPIPAPTRGFTVSPKGTSPAHILPQPTQAAAPSP